MLLPTPSKTLQIVYPVLPPTSNHMYFRGTILTKKAREYAETFSMVVTRKYLHLISMLDPEALYGIHLIFYFETVINASYRNPKLKESKWAKTRYKKFDLTNRIKLLEDCIKDVIGIDDSQTFIASQEKRMDSTNPRVEIYIYEVDPHQFGIPEEALSR